MTKFARVVDGVALEVFTPPAGSTLVDCFHPDIADQFTECPNNVVPNSTVDEDGDWIIAAPAQPAPAPVVYPRVGPIAFKLLFTSAERIKAKELEETNAAIKDFWSLLDDVRTTEIDMNLASVRGAIEYTLTAVKSAGVTLTVASRLAQILTGQPS